MSADFQLYSDELSAQERDLGFELRETANPMRHVADRPSRVRAVVFMVSRTDRIIKSRLPTGHFSYGFQRFGIWQWQSITQADWKPLSAATYPTPELALGMIRSGAEVIGRVLQLVVIPIEPGVGDEAY